MKENNGVFPLAKKITKYALFHCIRFVTSSAYHVLVDLCQGRDGEKWRLSHRYPVQTLADATNSTWNFFRLRQHVILKILLNSVPGNHQQLIQIKLPSPTPHFMTTNL